MSTDVYEFGACRLDAAQRSFTRAGHQVPLAPKTFALLLLLAQAPGRVLTKQQLMSALWPDTFVEEANLSFQISVLRKALATDAALIQTVPKHGYRLAAEVRPVRPVLHAASAPVAVASYTPAAPPSKAGAGMQWVTIAGVSAFLAGLIFVVVRTPPATPTATPAVAIPLTGYPGFEGDPSLSPDGSQVAFTWDGPGQDNNDIYVKLVGPGQPVRLTSDPRWDASPAWSPDSRWLAFERYEAGGRVSVVVVPALGGAERVIARLDSDGAKRRLSGNLAWTPDGSWIAVGGRPSAEAPAGIWLIPMDGTDGRQLTAAGAIDSGDSNPAFSPDGRQMAFIRARGYASSAVYQLALSSALTPAGRPIRVTDDLPNVQGLAWSPDGRSLVFSSGGHVSITRLQRIAASGMQSTTAAQPELLPFGEQATAVTVSPRGRLVYAAHSRDAALWKLPLPGSHTPHTALVPVPVASSTYDEYTPDYSPDGNRLAFASNRSGYEEIWIADADGSNPTQMTFMKGPLCANPRWSPDGRTILFNSRREGSGDLYLLTPNTGEIRRITDDPAEEGEPRWSRDGHRIYFGSNRTGRLEVWSMPATGGPAVRITRLGGLTATESPDRRFLYYAKQLGSPTAIWRVPVDGGEEFAVVDGVSNSLAFVVADRGLFFLAVRDAHPWPPWQVLPRSRQSTSIDFFEFATGKRMTVFVVGKQGWAGMALSPDQQSLLYSVIDGAGSNLMLVDRFQ